VITLRSDLKVVIASRPVDFRKGIQGLSALVAEALAADPFCGDVFVFRSSRANRLKLLAWDGTGMILATKYLESGRFTWPPATAGAVNITPAQMAMLVDGLDWSRVRPIAVERPRKVG
jgi:transposase